MKQKRVAFSVVLVCSALVLVLWIAAKGTAAGRGERDHAGPQEARASSLGQPAKDLGLTDSDLSGPDAIARAKELLVTAAGQEANEAIATLHRILRLDLPQTPEADKLLAIVHEQLGHLYEGTPPRQVRLYANALQLARDPGHRARLQQRIAELGGDVVVLDLDSGQSDGSSSQRHFGHADSCPTAVAVMPPHSEMMSIDASGDHNWRSFDVLGPEGSFVRIETISDMPGSFTDDTDLGLWDDCPENDGMLIAFNDDKDDDFTSRIDTDCLIPGTYFVEVGGFFDLSTPDNFTLEIEVTDSCVSEVCCVQVVDADIRTQGFWKHICKGPPHPSGEQLNLQTYLESINDFATFMDVDTVAELCDGLFVTPQNSKCEQAEAQFTALLLNVVSGRIAICNCIDDPDLGPTTVGNAIHFIDALLSDPARTDDDCELAQRIADRINKDESPVSEEQCTPVEDFCGLPGIRVDAPYFEHVDLSFGEVLVRAFDVDVQSLVTIETRSGEPLIDDTMLSLLAGPDDNGDCRLELTDDDGGEGLLSKIEVCLPPADELLGNTFANANYVVQLTGDVNADCFDLVIEVGGPCDPPPTCDEAFNVLLGTQIDTSIDPACDFDSYKLSLPPGGLGTFVSIETTGVGDTICQILDCTTLENLGCDDDSGVDQLSLLEGCMLPGDYCVRCRGASTATFPYGIEFRGIPGCGFCNQPDLGFMPPCMTDDDCPDPLTNPIPGFPPCIPLSLFGPGFQPPLSGDNSAGCVDFDTCP